MQIRLRMVLSLALLVVTTNQALAQNWVAVGTGQARAARIEQPGAITGLGFVCNRDRPLLSMMLAQPAAANLANARFMIGDQQVSLQLQRNVSARWPIYVANLADTRLVDMIRVAQPSSRLVVLVDSRTTAVINLAGAREAIASALVGCNAPTPAATPAPSAGAPTPGFYLEGSASECPKLSWDAMFWYGPDRDPVRKVDSDERLDASWRVIDRNRIQTSIDNGEGKKESITYYRCDERVLPPDARYFDQPKKISALPITPGYYRLRAFENVVRYFLFDTNRIAWMDDVAWDRQGNPTRRANVIRPLVDISQEGLRVYTFKYKRYAGDADSDGMDFVPLLIEAPGRFEGWFAELGTARYEPVTTQQIPAALRPHF